MMDKEQWARIDAQQAKDDKISSAIFWIIIGVGIMGILGALS